MSVKELVEAAGEGDVAAVERLAAAGVELDGQRIADGRSALHEAAARGHAPVVALLIRLGAPLEARDDNMLTPLLHAAAAGHLPILKALIEAGADLHALAEGRSALQLARTFNHDATAAFLEPLFRNSQGAQWRSSSAASSSTSSSSASSSHASHPTPSYSTPSSSSPTSFAHSSHSYASNSNPSTTASSAPTRTSYPTERGEVLILIEMSGAVIGVADVAKGCSLASLRRQMREDSLSPAAAFRFLYRDTGAPVTERQESRFAVDDCLIPDAPLPRLRLAPAPPAAV